MAIDLATNFLPYVDEKFKAESKASLITNKDYDWTGAHSVKVYKINTSKMNDYDRAGTGGKASRYGDVQGLDATTEEMILKKDRSFTYAIDKLDSDETKRTLQAASSLERQTREVVIPEVDAYVYGVMATSAGTKDTGAALTPDTVYDKVLDATKVLDDAEVPETQRVLIVSPDIYKMMKQSKDVVLNSDIGENMRLRGVIAELDGMQVIKVPANRLPEKFCFMVCHPSATVAPVKLEDYTIHQNPPGINGDLVEGRICYDAFVLENKAKAIYVYSTNV